MASPPLLLSNRTKARGHITNVRQRPAVHLAPWVRYTLLALSAASCITSQKVIQAKFEQTIPSSRKGWPHHRPHPANEQSTAAAPCNGIRHVRTYTLWNRMAVYLHISTNISPVCPFQAKLCDKSTKWGCSSVVCSVPVYLCGP